MKYYTKLRAEVSSFFVENFDGILIDAKTFR